MARHNDINSTPSGYQSREGQYRATNPARIFWRCFQFLLFVALAMTIFPPLFTAYPEAKKPVLGTIIVYVFFKLRRYDSLSHY